MAGGGGSPAEVVGEAAVRRRWWQSGGVTAERRRRRVAGEPRWARPAVGARLVWLGRAGKVVTAGGGRPVGSDQVAGGGGEVEDAVVRCGRSKTPLEEETRE